MPEKKKVTVYSTTTCPWCHRAMDFLKENKIEFEEVNIAKHPEKAKEMIDKSGQMSVPVIDIDGQIIVGFDREKIKSALGIK